MGRRSSCRTNPERSALSGAYVAMSRARDTSHLCVAADDLDQAVEDLAIEWSADRRQRWVLDVDEPALEDRVRRPTLARRTKRGASEPGFERLPQARR